MCGCSANFNGDERDIITQDEFNRDFDFTGNRPSIIEVGETWEDPAFDFTGNRPSIVDVGENSMFDFMSDVESSPSEFNYFGGKAKQRKELREQGLTRKQARKVVKGKLDPALLKDAKVDPVTGETIVIDPTTGETIVIDPATGMPLKTTYGQGDWLSRNWIWVVLGVGAVGVGFYIYKKRK